MCSLQCNTSFLAPMLRFLFLCFYFVCVFYLVDFTVLVVCICVLMCLCFVFVIVFYPAFHSFLLRLRLHLILWPLLPEEGLEGSLFVFFLSTKITCSFKSQLYQKTDNFYTIKVHKVVCKPPYKVQPIPGKGFGMVKITFFPFKNMSLSSKYSEKKVCPNRLLKIFPHNILKRKYLQGCKQSTESRGEDSRRTSSPCEKPEARICWKRKTCPYLKHGNKMKKENWRKCCCLSST